jgi:transposase InsO family protein
MINKMREENYSVDELCEAFEVSRSGYYAARKRPTSQRAKENEIIVSKMKEIHSDRHLKAYGSPRMITELQEEHGLACSENRVARLMANNDLKARHNASFRPKTTVQDTTQKASPNILANTEKPSAPGQICVSDITYVATREGWLYLAVVIDLYSRAVVGWSVAETMHTFLVSSALSKAMSNLPQGSRPLFHSDRGCQ